MKMPLNAFITVVVPAPEEPVTAMMGCLVDMGGPSQERLQARRPRLSRLKALLQRALVAMGAGVPVQRALLEQRRLVGLVGAGVELLVVALDALDLVARA